MRNVGSGALHRRKWTAVLLVLSMMVTLCMPIYSRAQDAPAETVPEGYIGIYDIADLYGIRNDLSANYILMKDIDMSEDTAEGGDWNLTGHGWTPIDGFKGIFDGNGHRIIGMHIYGEMEQSVGLFGKVEDSYPEPMRIKNLAMVDIAINVELPRYRYSVGGIIGSDTDSYVEIENTYTTGEIVVNHNLASDGSSYHGVGGLIGDGGYSKVSNSYNACDIRVDGDDVYLSSVSGIGDCCKANCCYNIGKITDNKGTDKAYSISGKYATDCYSLSGMANTDNLGCTVLFPTQLKDKRTLVGFDFDNVWEIDPYCDYPYPQLKSNRQIRIVSVDIIDEPVKTEYEQGDSLDISGGTVRITYEDETTAMIPITEDMVSGYDMNVIGEQNVTVSYCGIGTTYPIIVKEVPLRGISLNQSKVSLGRNKSLQLSVNYTPANASDKTIEWTSSDSSIAKVDNNGLVTAKNKGTATITATSANGLVAQCQVEVLIPCATITLNKTSANMKVGDTLKLTAQMLPLDTTDVLEWKSSNATVADVAGGTVTAYQAGTAKIIAYVEGGVSVTCKVTVKNSSTSGNNNTGKARTVSSITSVKGRISSIKKAGSRSIKLKLGNLGSADGYQIQYSLKKNFKNSKKIKRKSTNITIKKLKKNRRYYVRARVYGKVNGKTYYGKWSARKSVKTKNSVSVSTKKSFITNSNFKGTFTIGGEAVSYESGGYELVIDKITAKGAARFQFHRWSSNAGRMADSNQITAKIKGNKVSFKFKDISRGSKGKGTIIFNKDKSVFVKMEVTEDPDGLYGLDIEKTRFKKVS